MSGTSVPVNQLLDLASSAGAPLNALAAAPVAPAPVAQADPGDYSARYNTPLSPEDEARFQAWGQQQAARDPDGRNPAADVYDYDMRGFWRGGAPLAANGHAGDQFKKPNHPTFSDQSQYHGQDGYQGGQWGGGQSGQPWTFLPSETNLEHHGVGKLQQYFQKREPGNVLVLPTTPMS